MKSTYLDLTEHRKAARDALEEIEKRMKDDGGR